MVLKLFDHTIAATGINEKTAQAAGLDFDRVILSPTTMPPTIPGPRS